MTKRSAHTTPKRKKEKRARLIKGIAMIAVLLIALRILLPYVVLHHVNKSLANINGYYGHVYDIDICLYRGAYQVDSIYINKLDSVTQKQTHLFSTPKVDISIEWRSLLKGKIVSEMYFFDPIVEFTEGAAEPEQMEKDTNDFRKILKTFTPFKVNRFEVFNGKLGYRDFKAEPDVNIHADNIYVLATNLSNVADTALLPANVKATANIYGGSFDFNMRINALAEHPTYDLNATAKNVQLVQLNPMFNSYADFDVNKGTLDAYMEIAAKDRKFVGYVKPLIKDLDVVGREDRKDPFLRQLWEGMVGVAKDLLENDKTDQVATKIPIAGSYDDSTVGVWYAILGALRNAFIQALYPSVDNQVNIATPGKVPGKPTEKKDQGFFKKLFGKPGTPTEKKRKKKKD
jgi:hypothetical protein